jgi:peptide subunit release factor 1 (eRF1)
MMFTSFNICCIALQLPPNGLVVYTGMVMTEEGKEKKVNIDFEPFKPIITPCKV